MNKLWRLIARNLVTILVAASGVYLLSKYVLNILVDLFGKIFGECQTYLELDLFSPEEASNYVRTHPNLFYCFSPLIWIISHILLFVTFYLIVRKILIKVRI